MQQTSRTISFQPLTSATQRHPYESFIPSCSNTITSHSNNINYNNNNDDDDDDDIIVNPFHANNANIPGAPVDSALGYQFYNNPNIFVQQSQQQTNACSQPPEAVPFQNNLQSTAPLVVVERKPPSDNRDQNTDPNARDSITIALEEIGAIVNGQEFQDLTPLNRRSNDIDRLTTTQASFAYDTFCSNQQAADYKLPVKLEPDCAADNETITPNLTQVTAIYESLKKTIIESDANDPLTMMTTESNDVDKSNNNHHQQTLQHNNNHYDLFDRCTADGPVAMSSPQNESKTYVEIVEQPAKCALRFRYKCEGRSAGSLPGVNSTTENKTYPTIRINNYVGRAVVVISCVTKDAPYKAHPHNIVGKEGCKKGICTIVLNNNTNRNNNNNNNNGNTNGNSNNTNDVVNNDNVLPTQNATVYPSESATNITRTFNGLGIQCVKRRDIEESLTLRESINVDPFRNGFAHKLDTSNVDLNVVRLCFQVFIEGTTPNKCDIPLTPVVSEPIHDKKAMSDLVITKLSHCSAPATGGREIILLCDRISKDDIQVRFFEERDGKLVWETYSEVSPADVHKQVAICLRTPKYFNEHITQPVMARVQLARISDGQLSEPRLFQFLPCESDEDIISRKRQKIEWVNMNHYALDNILQPTGSHHQIIQQPHLQQSQQPQQQQQQQQQHQSQYQPSHHQVPTSHVHQQATHTSQRPQ